MERAAKITLTAMNTNLCNEVQDMRGEKDQNQVLYRELYNSCA